MAGLLAVVLSSGGCAGENGPPDPAADCAAAPLLTLQIAEHIIVDPAQSGGCVRLPSPAAGAEHLVVTFSGAGQESADGAIGAFTMTATGGTGAAPGAGRGAAPATPDEAQAFHLRLRAMEREASRRSRDRDAGATRLRRMSAPAVGDTQTFQVCKTTDCDSFVQVPATARYAGGRVALFVDDTVPAGGFSQLDLSGLGTLFDQQLYPVDTTAFGRESDIDGNGVVIVLLTDQLNQLSAACETTGQVVLGYFLGHDLLPGTPHSNGAEVYYGPVPDPSRPLCFGKAFVLDRMGPTFLHEFQHMISFNRHVLLGGGESEETWLNEGLSHLAEELGARRLPSGVCTSGNCLNQFAAKNIRNAFQYLSNPESNFLVEPGTSAGTLAERGANWLFVRWLLDQSPTDSLLGTDLTRLLLGADQSGGITAVGGTNVTAVAQAVEPDVTFPELVGQWHLSNYTETLTGFADPTGRLRYRSWNLRGAFDQLLPGPYPLRPDSTSGADYRRDGKLRGGSGAYLRVVQDPATTVEFTLRTSRTARVLPRVAVLRLR